MIAAIKILAILAVATLILLAIENWPKGGTR
jgi:hypothetical protein